MKNNYISYFSAILHTMCIPLHVSLSSISFTFNPYFYVVVYIKVFRQKVKDSRIYSDLAGKQVRFYLCQSHPSNTYGALISPVYIPD